MVRNFILYTIISGLVVNLLANMIWKYLPETGKRLDLIITAILIMVCALILLLPHIRNSKYICSFFRHSDRIALFILIIACIVLGFCAYHEQKQYGQPRIGKYKSEGEYLDLNGNGQLDAGEPYWILMPPDQGSVMPDEK